MRNQLPFYGLYIGQFAFLGVQLPFLSGWLSQAGFSINAIGVITGIALAIRIVSGPFVGLLADQKFSQSAILQSVALLMTVSAIGVAVFPFALPLAIASVAVMVAFGLIVPISDTALTRAERSGHVNFGFVRASGSAAFILMNIIGGILIDLINYQIALVAMCIASFVALISARALEVGEPQAVPARKFSFIYIKQLLGNPVFVIFLLAVSAIQASHAVYYAFSILHWTSIGIPASVIGVLWGTGVLAEVLVLAKTRRVHQVFTATSLIAFGGLAAFIRWSITSTEPSVTGLFIIQLLHSLTFASTYLGTILFLRRAVPDQMSNTAMTITSTFSIGAATGLATIVGGAIYAGNGPSVAYLSMALLGILGLILSFLLRNIWRGDQLQFDQST